MAEKEDRICLIEISGLDQVGVLAGVSGLLAREGIGVLDVGASVIHSTLSLGLLVRMPPQVDVQVLTETLETLLEPIGLRPNLTEVSEVSYEAWVERGGQTRHIITLLVDALTADQLLAVSNVCARHGLNIDRVRRLSGRLPLHSEGSVPHCIEVSVQGVADREADLRAEWLDIGEKWDIDISVQLDNVFRRNRRLVVFDMDSTLVDAEIIDELANRAGIADEVAKITETTMQGEMEFAESLRARTRMLKGLPISVLEEIARNLPLIPGAKRLIRILRRLGYKVAIISGGFYFFANHLASLLEIDYVFANELEIRGGFLTGNILGPVVDRARKAELLKELSRREGISQEQVIAVGDGANDIEMLSAAGLGVAYRAKPIVAARSKHAISRGGLDSILFLLGITARELDQVLPEVFD